MSALSSVLVQFTADTSGVQRQIRNAMNDIRGQANAFSSTGNIMGGAFSKFKAVALPAIGAVSTALGGISAAKGLQFNADMEQSLLSFTTLLNSAEEAKKMVKDLQKFSAATPFEFPGLQNSAKLMLAMGFNAKDILPNMRAIGDAVAAVGGGEEKLQGVTMALGQMLTKGKVSAEEMNQLAERGIPAWELMAQKMGMSKQQLMDMASEGKVMADQAVPALIDALGTKFAGAMDLQSKSFTGMMSTLKDNLNMLLGQAVEPLFNKIKEILPSVIDAVNKASDALAKGDIKGALEALFPKSVADGICFIGKAVADLITFIVKNADVILPILAGIVAGFMAFKAITFIMSVVQMIQFFIAVCQVMGGVVAGIGAIFGTAFLPILAVAAAIAAVVAIGILVWKNWDKISAFLVKCWEWIKNVAISVWGGIVSFFSGLWTSVSGAIAAAWNGIIGFLSDLWNGIISIAVSTWTGLVNFFTGLWNGIIGVFKTVWGAIAPFIINILNIIKTAFGAYIGTVFTIVKTIFTNIYTVISTYLKSVVAVFTAIWETIKVIVATAIMAVYYLFTGEWGKILEVFKAAGEKIWAIISGLFTTLYELWVGAFTAIIQTTLGAWESIKTIWINALNAIWGFLCAAWEWIKGVFIGAMTAIWNFLVGAWENIKATWNNALNALKTWWSNTWNNVKETVGNAWKSIVDFFLSAPGKIWDAMQRIGKSVKDTLSNLGREAVELGGNIVKGLWNGICNLAGWIKDKISGFITNNVIGWAKGVLGIHSPSRVFMKIGRHTIEGLSKGFDNSGNLAKSSMSDVIDGVISKAQRKDGFSVGFSPVSADYSAIDRQSMASGTPITVQQLVVREEADIERIAKELHRIQTRNDRSRGL